MPNRDLQERVGGNGRAPPVAEPGYSASPEPVPVSAQRASIPSRGPADEERQIAEMRACGDLRTCQDCGASVPYLFSNRPWHGYAARCGRDTVRARVCPDGYQGDRGPYPAGTLEAMSPERLMDEMFRAYCAQASVVDSGGSDDASYRAERRCEHVEAELKARGLEEAYWQRCDAEEAPASCDRSPLGPGPQGPVYEGAVAEGQTPSHQTHPQPRRPR